MKFKFTGMTINVSRERSSLSELKNIEKHIGKKKQGKKHRKNLKI